MKPTFLNFTKMKTIKLFSISMLVLALFVSCSDDDDAPVAVIPQEVITNVSVTFTNANDAADVVTLTAVSADGIVDPTLNIPGAFTTGATYNATLSITDEVNNENILEEVVEEKDDHFFVYAVNNSSLFTVVRADNDEVRTDGEKLGLNTTWTAGTAGSGTLTVQLIHEPTLVNDDNGFGSATGGEFDVNNTWNIVIQ